MSTHRNRAGELTKRISKEAVKLRVEKYLSAVLSDLEAISAQSSDHPNTWRDDGKDGIPIIEAEILEQLEAERIAALKRARIFPHGENQEHQEFSAVEHLEEWKGAPSNEFNGMTN